MRLLVLLAFAFLLKGDEKVQKLKMGKEEKTENTPDDNLDTKEIEPVKQNDFELAIRSCKELEFILETEFASTGTSLHEKITNCNTSLPIELISECSRCFF